MSSMYSSQAGVEVHLENILRSWRPAWQSYKNHLARLYNKIRQNSFGHLRFEEGDCYIRFNVSSDALGLNRLHFIYEIGYVVPDIRWRGLIRSRIGLAPILLNKKTTFLPAFNYCLDKTTTFIYWGEKQIFFDPEQIEQLDLKSLPVCLASPSQVPVSAANLVWPKAVEKIFQASSGLAQLTKLYLYNSLFAPEISNFHDFWSEAPFVLIGDREVELFGVHKTICSVDLRTVRSLWGSGNMRATAFLIDRHLEPRKIQCIIPADSLPFFEEQPIREAIVTKYARIHDETSSKKTVTAVSLHPFESSHVFEHEAQGLLTTALSLVLRLLYLRSDGVTALNASLNTAHDLVLSMFRKFPFTNYQWTDMAAKTIMKPDGLKILLSLLRVYQQNERGLNYLHPSLLESALNLGSQVEDLSVERLQRLIAFLAGWLANFERNPSFASSALEMHQVLEFEDSLRKELGISASLRSVQNAIHSMIALERSVAPISKTLCGEVA